VTRLTVLGRLTASDTNNNNRELRGLMLPYGQPGQTNLGTVTVSPGVIDVPATMSRLCAALEHPAREVGSGEAASFTRVWEEADGLHASWRAAANPAGDRLLAEFAAGTRTGISVELEPIAIDAQGRITAGRLDAVAFPVRPAFDGARLTASAPAVDLTDDRTPERLLADFDSTSSSTSTEEYDDPETGEHVVVTYTRTTRETAAEERDGQPVDDNTEDDSVDPEDETQDGGTRLAAGRRSAGNPRPAGAAQRPAGAPGANGQRRQREHSMHDVMRLLATFSSGDDRSRRMVAALSDITETATSITRPPAWLGELWSAQPYTRVIVPLLNQANLTNLRVKGWRWVKKPYMADYAGDKANIPSDVLEYEEYEEKASRLAGGHDIDRAHVDFGDTAFFEAYYRAMAESYARQTDKKALTKLITEAKLTTITPGVVPADIDKGTSAVVDLALSMIDRGAMTSAIVAKDVYRSMLLTPQDKRLAFLSQSLGLENGTVDTFRVIPRTDLKAGEIVGLIKGAVTFRELGETPLRADALDIARGGVDHACYGYYHIEANADGLAYADITAGD